MLHAGRLLRPKNLARFQIFLQEGGLSWIPLSVQCLCSSVCQSGVVTGGQYLYVVSFCSLVIGVQSLKVLYKLTRDPQ